MKRFRSVLPVIPCSCYVFLLLLSMSGQAQSRLKQSQPPRDWPYLDPTADSIAGISLYKAYDLLKGRPSVPVIVGVIDSGVDIAHEDLKDVIW